MAKQTAPRAKPVAKPLESTSPRIERTAGIAKKPATQMPFDRINYLMLGGCVGLITLGYALMRMDNAVDGFISLYISPLLLLAGYLGVIYAVLKRPHHEKNETTSQA